MRKVLYIDDSSMSQQLMARFLEGICHVTPCTSLSSATQTIRTQNFDLIITDFLFPEGDPLEFIAELRRHFSPTQLPVIVTSGSLDRRMESQALHFGANACIRKPLRKNEVRELVERLFKDPTPQPLPNLAVVSIFTWIRNGRYYALSPDTLLHAEGSSEAEALAKLKAQLEEYKNTPSQASTLGTSLACKIQSEEISN
ncbi:MAG: response regulator [Chthoniobacterales bacterium]|nr:response regulator [Chthoniobacterales bacterium]MCX7713694.1 response regulator [Chthoniobacterales bacterium]